jgi:hypothetical protein
MGPLLSSIWCPGDVPGRRPWAVHDPGKALLDLVCQGEHLHPGGNLDGESDAS